jgi:glutathione S-transferase
MEIASRADLLSALVTILALILYTVMIFRVGSAREKYKVEAPAIIGSPDFERTYRVQLNTLESLPVFLAALWLATIYFTRLGWLPAALGLVWVIGRFLYMQGYIADAKKRGLGFITAGLAQIALILLALAGVVMAWSIS